MYLLIGKAHRYVEENNGNNYLVFTSADGNSKIVKVLVKFTKLWDEIKHLIETINGGKKGEYEKGFIKIKFNSDHD